MAVDRSGSGVHFTAVVADRMPLVRIGLAASLDLIGVATVAEVEEFAEGVEAARDAQATLLVLGGAEEATAQPLGRQMRRLGATRVVVLVAEVDRRTLVTLLEAGADAVALRTIVPEDLGVLVRRVLAGERAVDPALMPILLDLARDRAVSVDPDPSRSAAGMAVMVVAPASEPGGAPVAEVDAVSLTSKELQVLDRLAHGDANADIAAALFVSPATVKTHLAHIYAKLGVGSRHGALSRAAVLGILP